MSGRGRAGRALGQASADDDDESNMVKGRLTCGVSKSTGRAYKYGTAGFFREFPALKPPKKVRAKRAPKKSLAARAVALAGSGFRKRKKAKKTTRRKKKK